MKATFAAVFTVMLATASLAFAQDESPSPSSKLGLRATDPTSRSEPTVSVPSEKTDENYPKPGTPLTTSTPAASTTAAAASPRPAKTTARSKATPAPKSASPTPAPAAAAAATTTKAPEPAVRELENRWLTALQSHDTATVEPFIADSYIGVSSTGKFVNKAGLLAEIKKDTNKYKSATNARMDVRVHGDTVIVVGTTRQSGEDATGKQFTYTARWTDTWAFRENQWLCIGSQSMQVPR